MNNHSYSSDPVRVISYARVSSGAQAESGLGTDAQHHAVDRGAAVRGWRVIDRITDEAVSGSVPTQRRPRLRSALEQLARGDAEVLVVARSDRLARTMLELLRLYERAESEGWMLVCLDAPFDVESPESRLFIGVRAAIAEFEAAMAKARTAEALGVARLRGVRSGRPSKHSEATKQLAAQLRAAGCSLAEIAAALTDVGVVTPAGNDTWSRSSVQSLLRTVNLDNQARANAEAHRRAHTGRDPDTEAPQQRAA
ncbi:recombinase family protein [Candidatus Poriferisodalis sp.]|uniref:recombinase family protein n=1 Tax=Candidatus Poriferisodalis sp. TaxID=3101277 RepID=UPI003B52FA56